MFSSTLRTKVPAALKVAVVAVLSVAALFCWTGDCSRSANAAALPAPVLDVPAAKPGAGKQTVVFAGGCFWGVQAVFQHVKGVEAATSGYAGGPADKASYDLVSTGTTGHAESVRVTFDPARVTYGQLLNVFFSVAHDPTQLDRQGPDEGTQYRSAVFFTTPDQQRVTKAYIAQLDRAKVLGGPIVTAVAPLDGFYPAEAYHQDYARRHPDDPYIAINDAPKVQHLRALFPALYR
jgi:peptide-methionine (S)-S-oxide reductase